MRPPVVDRLIDRRPGRLCSQVATLRRRASIELAEDPRISRGGRDAAGAGTLPRMFRSPARAHLRAEDRQREQPQSIRRAAVLVLVSLAVSCAGPAESAASPMWIAPEQLGGCRPAQDHGLLVDGFVATSDEKDRVFAGWAHDAASARADPRRCTSLTRFEHRAVLGLDVHHVGFVAEALGLLGSDVVERVQASMLFPDDGSPEYLFEIPRDVVDAVRGLDDARLVEAARRAAEQSRASVATIQSERMRTMMLREETDERWATSFRNLRGLCQAAREPERRVYVFVTD